MYYTITLSWKREALSEDNISLLLEYLSIKGVLSEKKNKILRVCHSCKSSVSILECQECGSKNIVEERKILHRCGYLDVSSGFIYQDYLMCPLCGEAISFGDDVGRDYRFSDAVYKCEDCGSTVSKYDKLNENGACIDCGDINRTQKQNLYHSTQYPDNLSYSL